LSVYPENLIQDTCKENNNDNYLPYGSLKVFIFDVLSSLAQLFFYSPFIHIESFYISQHISEFQFTFHIKSSGIL